MSIMDYDLQEFKALLFGAKRVVVFTGAGISTESGIPDFRSPGGIWSKHKPIPFQDFLASEEVRRESWNRKFATDSIVRQAIPNTGHLAIAQLCQDGIVSAVITQNIDGLHQKSGIPDEKVIELHGNGTYASCLECKKHVSLKVIKKLFETDRLVPVCTRCGGIVKTATISFGQPMPEAEMRRADEETLLCDLFIVIGSSLVVYPAAAFPALAKQNGAKLIILNREATDMDPIADLAINREIGPTLTNLIREERD